MKQTLFATVALIALSTVAHAEAWRADHNGSTMTIEKRGVDLVITYTEPKPSLAPTIHAGMRVIDAKITPQGITGTAYAFKAGCEPAPYRVIGTVAGSVLTFRGDGPVRQGCAFTLSPTSPHSTLVFSITAKVAETVAPPPPPPPPKLNPPVPSASTGSYSSLNGLPMPKTEQPTTPPPSPTTEPPKISTTIPDPSPTEPPKAPPPPVVVSTPSPSAVPVQEPPKAMPEAVKTPAPITTTTPPPPPVTPPVATVTPETPKKAKKLDSSF